MTPPPGRPSEPRSGRNRSGTHSPQGREPGPPGQPSRGRIAGGLEPTVGGRPGAELAASAEVAEQLAQRRRVGRSGRAGGGLGRPPAGGCRVLPGLADQCPVEQLRPGDHHRRDRGDHDQPEQGQPAAGAPPSRPRTVHRRRRGRRLSDGGCRLGCRWWRWLDDGRRRRPALLQQLGGAGLRVRVGAVAEQLQQERLGARSLLRLRGHAPLDQLAQPALEPLQVRPPVPDPVDDLHDRALPERPPPGPGIGHQGAPHEDVHRRRHRLLAELLGRHLPRPRGSRPVRPPSPPPVPAGRSPAAAHWPRSPGRAAPPPRTRSPGTATALRCPRPAPWPCRTRPPAGRRPPHAGTSAGTRGRRPIPAAAP